MGTPDRQVPNNSNGNTVPIQRCQAGACDGSSHHLCSAPPNEASSTIQSPWSRRHAMASRNNVARSLRVLRALTKRSSSPVSSQRAGCSPSSSRSSVAAASSSGDGTSRSTGVSDVSTDRAAMRVSSSSGLHCKSASSPDAVRTRLRARSNRGRAGSSRGDVAAAPSSIEAASAVAIISPQSWTDSAASDADAKATKAAGRASDASWRAAANAEDVEAAMIAASCGAKNNLETAWASNHTSPSSYGLCGAATSISSSSSSSSA
mmetsp:Transcript_7324/g.22875  ORF Transcript_7324/g.22875 Transcript_7324/m.22875 type:complete len:263 (-) Transcript_7324:1343-2131(-)